MIHICYCFNDKTGRYAKFVGTSMLSIFENCFAPSTQSIIVHLLHDNTLTQDNREKFIYLAGQYNQLVKFYNVEERCADKIAEIKKAFPNAEKSRFSIGMFYRFFIPQILSKDIEKAVYLDADIIVNLDISELYQIDLDDKIIGVVTHKKIGVLNSAKTFPLCSKGFVNAENYFNSGVLLMNLNSLRKNSADLLEGTKFIAAHPECQFLDQDILNYTFRDKTLELPGKFNSYIVVARREDEKKATKNRIYHYNGNADRNSFGLDMNDYFNRLWMNYFIKTPWFDAATIGNLWEKFIQLRTMLKNSAMNISAKVSCKNRAFFIEPEKIELMKKTFAIRNDEMIISSENEESFQKLLDAMKNSKGKTVFFIMTPKFLKKNFPFDRLTKEGFIEQKDFWKGWNLLDNPLNSNQFIQAM